MRSRDDAILAACLRVDDSLLGIVHTRTRTRDDALTVEQLDTQLHYIFRSVAIDVRGGDDDDDANTTQHGTRQPARLHLTVRSPRSSGGGGGVSLMNERARSTKQVTCSWRRLTDDDDDDAK